MHNVIYRKGHYVVENDDSADFIALDAEIAASVTDDNLPSELLPLNGRIEFLVQISLKPKSVLSNSSANAKIRVTLLECG
jgi:hypothetical protein